MSATGRSDVRHKDDFYETPAWCVDALLAGFPTLLPAGGQALDPCCGKGAILNALPLHHKCHSGYEINEDRLNEAWSKNHGVGHVDALEPLLTWSRCDAVIMNPPYRLSLEFVQRALAHTPKVAALLRINWLSSLTRESFHRTHPACVGVFPRRPSFKANGRTDACEYGWFVWGCGGEGTWRIL